MKYNEIQAALEKTLEGISNVPQIAWENTNFEPTTGTAWVRPRFLPSDRRPRSLGVDSNGVPLLQRYSGMFQIVVCVPEGIGREATNNIVNKITEAFEAAKDLDPVDNVYVTILQTEKMRAYQDSPWYKTPVNVHWYSYTK